MISDADRGFKDRLGRAAYLYTGMKNLSAPRVKATVELDGQRFFSGRVSITICVPAKAGAVSAATSGGA